MEKNIVSAKDAGIEGAALLREQFALPPLILGKWIFGGSLAMVYAEAGTGKTFFSLSLTHAVITGGEFLGWHAKRLRRVVYFDSEMGARLIQDRFRKICESKDADADGSSVKFVTYAHTGGVMWNLASENDQRKYTEACEGFDLIIIDNLSGCVRPTKPRETEFDTWPRAQDWLLKMREAGKSVLIIHHAGKNGTQRGGSMRIDALDFVLGLKRPPEHRAEDGLRFVLKFEKCRHYIGQEGQQKDVRLTDFEQEKLRWIWDEYSAPAPVARAAKDLFGDV